MMRCVYQYAKLSRLCWQIKFTVPGIRVLLTYFELENLRWRRRNRSDPEMVFCFVLCELLYPHRLFELADYFEYSPSLSIICCKWLNRVSGWAIQQLIRVASMFDVWANEKMCKISLAKRRETACWFKILAESWYEMVRWCSFGWSDWVSLRSFWRKG